MPQHHDFQHIVRAAKQQRDKNPFDDFSVEAGIEFGMALGHDRLLLPPRPAIEFVVLSVLGVP